MKLVSGIVDSGFFAQSALSAEVATKDSLGRNISETYLTGVDLTPYQTTADMVNYQTTAGMTAYLTAVPESYLQNTDLTITDGKVTEISGVPLSAGDELPSGVMNTSALEYNAVNEISGYNGSAIAQYGAEKQWLVHDDTLVHASNSAQYALGVAIDNVARLLHIDETVLWSGNLSAKNEEISLVDSLKNYNSYKVFGYNTENKYGIVSEFNYNSAGPNWFSLTNIRIQNNAYLTIYGSFVSANTDWNKLKITYMSNKYCISGGLTHSTSYGVGITKIVGIGRKQ